MPAGCLLSGRLVDTGGLRHSGPADKEREGLARGLSSRRTQRIVVPADARKPLPNMGLPKTDHVLTPSTAAKSPLERRRAGRSVRRREAGVGQGRRTRSTVAARKARLGFHLGAVEYPLHAPGADAGHPGMTRSEVERLGTRAGAAGSLPPPGPRNRVVCPVPTGALSYRQLGWLDRAMGYTNGTRHVPRGDVGPSRGGRWR
jgi:hypothetical protein